MEHILFLDIGSDTFTQQQWNAAEREFHRGYERRDIAGMLRVDDINLPLAKEPGKPRGNDGMEVSADPQREDVEMPPVRLFLQSAATRTGKPHPVAPLEELGRDFKCLYFQTTPGM